jgi:hypothetical protein
VYLETVRELSLSHDSWPEDQSRDSDAEQNEHAKNEDDAFQGIMREDEKRHHQERDAKHGKANVGELSHKPIVLAFPCPVNRRYREARDRPDATTATDVYPPSSYPGD